jgi:hypothetical protein
VPFVVPVPRTVSVLIGAAFPADVLLLDVEGAELVDDAVGEVLTGIEFED